jgi:hypothetical protein
VNGAVLGDGVRLLVEHLHKAQTPPTSYDGKPGEQIGFEVEPQQKQCVLPKQFTIGVFAFATPAVKKFLQESCTSLPSTGLTKNTIAFENLASIVNEVVHQHVSFHSTSAGGRIYITVFHSSS